MKKKLYIILLLFITFIGGLFSPFFVINGIEYSLTNILANFIFSPIILLILLPFLLICIVLLLNLVDKNNYYFKIIEFIFSLASGLVFSFSYRLILLGYNNVNEIAFTPILLASICFAIMLYITPCLFDSNKLMIKDIVEIGIFVSFAIVLDMALFKIRIGQNGGSISFAMVPLFIICIRKGFFKGFIATGIVYGLITCLIDGYGLYTFPFDYLLGFGSIALVALFSPLYKKSNPKVKEYMFLLLAIFISLVFRTLFATISGIVFYNLNFVSSLIYQLTYIAPSAGIVSVVILLLFRFIIRFDTSIKKKY